MRSKNAFIFTALSTLILLIPMTTAATGLRPPVGKIKAPVTPYSPYVGDHYPQNVYFGDTHLHTSWSADAGMAGATLTPEDAYRVARGEVVESQAGGPMKLVRPLDFIVVADHAENLGITDFINRSDPVLLASPTGKRWHDLSKSGEGYTAFIEWVAGNGRGEDQVKAPEMMRSVWDKVVDNAEKNYVPGAFTTFIAFEWTSGPNGNNLHRNVIFRDGANRTKQVLPYSLYDSEDPEDLWAYMAAYEDKTGGRAFAIPHNGNLSNGVMFQLETLDGKAFDADYAKRRQLWEPVVEVTQPKGTSEAHPLLSPDDAFADFELLDKSNLAGSEAKTPEMLKTEYAREALKLGLAQEAKLGTNPYKFGMIGSTDAHNAIPSTGEENWFGKAYIVEQTPERFEDVLFVIQVDPSLSIIATDLGASGLAAVWATENTREAIWDAFARKEVYATTGNRLRVRVFGGWDFADKEVLRPDFVRAGYARGVPMGGNLSPASKGGAPKFMVRALRDPDGANLDRIQMIKGWVDAKGETQEKIYDIALSDDRMAGPDGTVPPVGDTVDLSGDKPTYSNEIGDAVMAAYWEDPDFDPAQRAFYYVRVIEIPTPRWTAYDAKYFGVKIPEGVADRVQDRAYTSPIWYTPKS